MQNIGEEIAGQYLKHCRDCEFIDYNIQTVDTQGEIDVVGINSKEKKIFLCEVAVHLETGLQYTKNNRPDNVERFTKKFEKDIQYAKDNFPGYKITAMLWSPIVRVSKPNSIHNQLEDTRIIKEYIMEKFKEISFELYINQRYNEALIELKEKAIEKTEELKSPVLRYMQIEEKLNRHLIRLEKQAR